MKNIKNTFFGNIGINKIYSFIKSWNFGSMTFSLKVEKILKIMKNREFMKNRGKHKKHEKYKIYFFRKYRYQ